MVTWTLILQSIGFGLVTAAIISIGAMGFTLQFGVTNILNISYGNVLTVGAFAALIAQREHLGLVLTVVAAPLAGALVTFVLARVVFGLFARRHASSFDLIMVTLASSLWPASNPRRRANRHRRRRRLIFLSDKLQFVVVILRSSRFNHDKLKFVGQVAYTLEMIYNHTS